MPNKNEEYGLRQIWLGVIEITPRWLGYAHIIYLSLFGFITHT